MGRAVLEQMRFVLARLSPDEREAFRMFAAQLGAANGEKTERLTQLATHLLD